MKKQCLIITATINPNSNYVAKASPNERRQEYFRVLEYYCHHFLGDIYFAENSDYDFSQDEGFQKLFNAKNVFYIACAPSNEFNKGKGYQEFKVLDDVVNRLKDKYDELIKVSGRYLVKNFKILIHQRNNGIVIDRHQKKQVAITSFFRCNMEVYQNYLKDCYKGVDDSEGIFIEHIIYQRLKKIDQKKIDIFVTTPIYKGVSGSYGGSLNRHPVKTKLINLERKFLRLKGEKELKKEFK